MTDQPEPVPARGFPDMDAEILQEFGVKLPEPTDPKFAETLESFNLKANPSYWLAHACIRAGLRRAAEIARAEPADDRDALLLQQRIANAILRECGEGGATRQ